ncbi:hypothetical protein Clacol_010065 [Clathrus columnatus]|uniref:Uncharacterized protein n=1 Tax=Clathrus columnatus TaxID=1419009 RepID=A0AAV5APS2_9AGAM|nr:hypothetical protein Clacol_010065 [Clathrus columnatus]
MQFTAVFSLLAILLTQVVAMPVLPSAVPSGTHIGSIPITVATGIPKSPTANGGVQGITPIDGGSQNTGPANSGSQGTTPCDKNRLGC